MPLAVGAGQLVEAQQLAVGAGQLVEAQQLAVGVGRRRPKLCGRVAYLPRGRSSGRCRGAMRSSAPRDVSCRHWIVPCQPRFGLGQHPREKPVASLRAGCGGAKTSSARPQRRAQLPHFHLSLPTRSNG